MAERLFGVSGIRLDRFRKFLKPGIEKVRGGTAALLDLLRHGLGPSDEQMLKMADAAVERVGDPHRLRAEHLVDFGAPLADGFGQFSAARVDDLGDVGDPPVDRGDDFSAAVGQRLGDVHNTAGQGFKALAVRLSSVCSKFASR